MKIPPSPKSGEVPPYTLEEIIKIEPRVGKILYSMKPVTRGPNRHRKYIDAKRQLVNLVGWSANVYELRTSHAYDVVMDYVINKLNL